MSAPSLVIVDAEVTGRRVDVEIRGNRITTITPSRRSTPSGPATVTIDACGAAVLPGLHDHHLHLVATAAARTSVDLADPTSIGHGVGELIRRRAQTLLAGAWLRVVGYDESMLEDLDRDELDRLVADRPIRVQHRSGAAWYVNSVGLDLLGVRDEPGKPPVRGIERDSTGRATGRLFRMDDWLRERIGAEMPDLGPVGRELAAAGVVGCTDATPWPSVGDLTEFRDAIDRAHLRQRVRTMTAPGVVTEAPVKVVLGDHDLPTLDQIEHWFANAHGHGRNVAVHVITAAALALALAAWNEVGALDGDRIEHGASIPSSALETISQLGVRVVTQPGLVRTRGDLFLERVPPDEHEELWRCGTLMAAGIRVAGSSDAPYGPIDPWLGVRAATERQTAAGRVLGPAERVPATSALNLYLSSLDDPGGPPRRIQVGATADLCVLDAPLVAVLGQPDVGRVVATVIEGIVVYAQ